MLTASTGYLALTLLTTSSPSDALPCRLRPAGLSLFLHSAQLTMGEYAIRKSDNDCIKIGTCEDMYYLRYEDQDKVTPDSGSGFGYRWHTLPRRG